MKWRIAAGVTLAVLLLGGGGWWLRVREERRFWEASALLSRFPAGGAIVVSIDVAALRTAGLAGTAAGTSEAEYKQFVDGTHFDYRKDLDSLVASFSAKGSYFVARGRFDWGKLREYVARSGGSCYQALCRVQGSTPERHISFLPLRNDALALAVSADDLAATKLAQPGEPVVTSVPSAPVWISVPGSELRRPGLLPPGMRVMLSGLQNTDRLLVTIGAATAQMEAVCRTKDDAKVLASQLRTLTATLRESKGKAGEMATALAGGTFEEKDARVLGSWPTGKGLLESLAGLI